MGIPFLDITGCRWRRLSFINSCSAGLLCCAALLCCLAAPAGAEEPAYRTDGGDEKLPWFQLKAGEFPPEGSAHHISGELISLDHVNRSGALRADRNDSQRSDDYDRPHPFSMLPYGSLRYHGAPAELRDIPIGTHLHGQFYFDPQGGKDGRGAFSKVLRLEDDFSYALTRNRQWRVDAVAIDKGTLTVTGVSTTDGPADPKPTTFQISPATRIWKGRGLGALADLAVGQNVLLNLTVCSLKGPGRCIDIWLDAESRQVAADQQRAIHRQYQMEHGLACVVDEVDNQQGTVTVLLFDGFDPSLVEEYKPNTWMAASVAEASLRTYDQNNDTINGPILEVTRGPASPGNSGIRIRYKPGVLLEGYRPQRIVRIFWGGWRIDDLPLEERLYE